MNRRWILALTAAVGVAMLTVPLLMEERPSAPAAETTELDVPSLASSTGPVCKTHAAGNLDFTLKDMNGASVHLADYKGKVVLVNFWATWCGPCKVEIPEFAQVYSEYKDQGFVILGVLANDTPTKDQLQAFMTEYKMTYPVLFSNDQIESAFGSVWALPTSFLIGRDGSVCAKQLGPASREDVERAIKALL
jgi:peroxiredoxin